MYLELDLVSTIEKNAKKFIIKDRKQYYPFFSIVEQYILDNSLIMMKAIDYDTISLNFHIYTETPKNDAKNLAKLLFDSDPNGLARYISVTPKIPLNIYSIYLTYMYYTFELIPYLIFLNVFL